MIDFRLYLITDRSLCAARSLEISVAEACRAGVRAVQLREKDLPAKEFYSLALIMREVTGRTGSKFFVNDRADVAKCVGADGVHCPENGLPVRAIRRFWPEALVGASAHSLERAREAGASGCDFVLFGPVFPTLSKARFGEPQGLEALSVVARNASVPVFAVGGVTPENAALCLEKGAAGVAVISAIMAARDVEEVVGAFRKSLGGL